MASRFPTPGEVFEDTYRIEAILGSGGFARVYRAVEVGLERPVALKILRPPTDNRQSDSQRDTYLETLMERFQREALMLSKLRSSYTVNLYKYGKTHGGLLYMALEYIDGLSLQEILRAGKPLAPSRVVRILQQVLTSLQEAHTLGMLHRDLKPANIMVYEHLGEKDCVKLLDFGIAKLISESASNQEQDLTGDGTLIGTPRYMAPEQIQGANIGPASDVYALGLVAYELLTAERAIQGDSSIQIIGKQLAPQSFTLPEGDSVPPGLRYVVNKMMEKDLSFRYANCEGVLFDLARPSILAFPDEVDLPEIEIDNPIEDLEEVPYDEASFDGLPPVMATRENLLDPVRDQRMTMLRRTFAVVVLAALAWFGISSLAASNDQQHLPDKVAKTQPEEPRKPDPATQQPKVLISAKLDGRAIEGVTVLVNGVEKGVTPLTLTADEVREARVVARYKIPDRDETLEDVQEVSDPRDVLFEFDALFGELIRPTTEVPEDAPREVQEEKVDPKPVEQSPKPRPKPRPKPKPDPRPSDDSPYVAPE